MKRVAILCSVVAVVAVNPVLNGYDTVAYHNEQRAVRGSEDHAYVLTTYDYSSGQNGEVVGDYRFLFSSEENKKAFSEDPWKYAPKYGGF